MTSRLQEQGGTNVGAGNRKLFHVVLIYEDIAAGMHGENVYESLVAKIHDESAHHLWSFDVLAIREIRNLAASTAATADLVILSMSGEKTLPAKVKEWIEMWVWLIDQTEPALATLFDTRNDQSSAISAYLRSVTERKHVRALSNTAFLPAVDFPLSQRSTEGRKTPRGGASIAPATSGLS